LADKEAPVGQPHEKVPPLSGDPIAFQAAIRPDRLACVDFRAGRRIAYRDLDTLVARAAGWLTAQIGPAGGERIAYLGRNSLQQMALLFACRRAGAIFQPLNWRLSGPELRALLADSGPRLVIYESEFAPAAREALSGAANARAVEDKSGALLAEIERAAPAAPAEMAEDAPFILLYTSGTTGRPKGVIVTRKNAYYSALNFIAVGKVGAGALMLCDAPMFHTVGLMAVTYTSIHAGAAVAMSDRFDAATTLARLSDRDLAVTHYFAVPQSAQMLRDHAAYAQADLTRLTGLFSGGAPMPPGLLERFLDDGVTVSNGFGMSEAGTVMHMPLDRALIRAHPRSCGQPAPHARVRIVTREGKDAGPGEPGELWLSGPGVSPGYWNQPEATAAAFSQGWLRTGDAAVLEDGFYRLLDRWKDMYITGGENVYPAEVEAVLAAMPGVAEIAIVGAPDPQWGEAGCAFIVRAAGADISAAAVRAFCEGKLARYKHPRTLRFVDALPRTASGKVQKAALRAMIVPALSE
jgi:fatty-acyl-CoA synthase